MTERSLWKEEEVFFFSEAGEKKINLTPLSVLQEENERLSRLQVSSAAKSQFWAM